MKFAIIYRPSLFDDPTKCDRAEWFDTLEAAREKAERMLSRHETKFVAIVQVLERAHTTVTWAR